MAPNAMARTTTTATATATAATSPSKAISPAPGKMAGNKFISKFSEEIVTKRPAGKTPLAALLSSKTQVKSGDGNLMLVTVNVLGSPGPLRFLVDRADSVSRVIDTAMRVYAREGRLPLLHSKQVELYCDNGDFKALHPSELVGGLGTRQFLLYRKKPEETSGDSHSNNNNTQAISHPLKHWWSFMSSLVCSH